MRKSGVNVTKEVVKKLTEITGEKVRKIARDALGKAKGSGCAKVWVEDAQCIIERDFRVHAFP